MSSLSMPRRRQRAARAPRPGLTKPRRSLGRVEEIGIQLCAIAGTCPPPVPEPVTVVVFAGDHGVVDEGVTPWPREVTAQMVANFCAGGAAVNVLARHVGAPGRRRRRNGVATLIPTDSDALVRRNVALGTHNLARRTGDDGHSKRPRALPSMSDCDVAPSSPCPPGARMLVTGDMGIGNTTAARPR